MSIIKNYVADNYQDILQWAKQISYNHENYMDLANDVIISFLEHPKAEGLVERGEARFFITRMLINQARSSTSPFAKKYRIHHEDTTQLLEHPNEEYDVDIDLKVEAIQGVCEDLKAETIEGYYCITIFELIMDQDRPNFSKLAQETGIPRTSISQAYYDAIDLIKNRLKQWN